MNNAVFGKIMENVRKHRDIKLVTVKARMNCLVSEPNYHATIFFFRKILAIEIKKNSQIFMNKPVYLDLSILEISKLVKYEVWYDYVKSKHGEKKIMLYGYRQLHSQHKSRKHSRKH